MQPIPLDGQTLPEIFIRSEADRPKVAYDAFSNEIPVISLANVDDEDDGVAGGGQGRRAEARRKIAEACEDWGVFQVVDHGVDQVLMDGVLRLSKEFFALPAEEKLKFDMTGGKRGGFLVSSHIQVQLQPFLIFLFQSCTNILASSTISNIFASLIRVL